MTALPGLLTLLLLLAIAVAGWVHSALRAARLQAERSQRTTAAYLRALFNESPVSIMVFDSETRRLVDANPAACRSYGVDSLEALRRTRIWDQSQPFTEAEALQKLQLASHQGSQQFEWRSRRADGSLFWEEVTLTPVRVNGERRILATSVDISALKAQQEALRQHANQDALTGLANRRFLEYRLQLAIARARQHNVPFALCYVDLDEFKPVNDTLGHGAGDEVLRTVARRLRSLLRSEDTMARIGGDEFALILNDVASRNACEQIAERMLAQVRSPLTLAGNTLNVSASIGLARFPDHGLDGETLIRHADLAMYTAKSRGRNGYAWFKPPTTSGQPPLDGGNQPGGPPIQLS